MERTEMKMIRWMCGVSCNKDSPAPNCEIPTCRGSWRCRPNGTMQTEIAWMCGKNTIPIKVFTLLVVERTVPVCKSKKT